MTTKTLNLKCDFTESDINDIAREMSDHINTKSITAENKAYSMRKFNAELKYWDKKIFELNQKITDGFEYRDINCEVEFNNPLPGQKTITRLDTNENWQEPMTIEEFDLFTQVGVNEGLLTESSEEE